MNEFSKTGYLKETEFLDTPRPAPKAKMETEFLGLKFRNPVIPAAGPNVRDGEALQTSAEGGAGGLLAKTVSVKAAPVPRPNMALYARNGMLNTELWTELTPEQWFEKEYPVGITAARKANLPFIASIGYSAEEIKTIAPKVEAAGVDAIEFTLHYVERDFSSAEAVAKTLRETVQVPIIAKLSPHFGDLGELAEVMEPYVDAFTCINSFGPTLRINIDRAEPIMGSQYGYGWLSGEPIKPLALRCVFEVARRVSKPVIGVGGISRGTDLIEFLMAGASMVGVCTAAILNGNTIYGQIAEEAAIWLDERGYSSIQEVQGLYLKKFAQGQRVIIDFEEKPIVSKDLCIGCTRCEPVCWYDALKAPPDEAPTIDENPCFQCGLCLTVCPTNALSFRPRDGITIPAGDQS